MEICLGKVLPKYVMENKILKCLLKYIFLWPWLLHVVQGSCQFYVFVDSGIGRMLQSSRGQTPQP